MQKNLTIGLFLLMVAFVSCQKPQPNEQKIALSDWKFEYEDHYFDATVPGCIHTDLFTNAIIDDPFFESNEDSVQWVSEKIWHYQTHFSKTEIVKYAHTELVFEGVDGHAQIWLNGKPLKHAGNSNQMDNMFRNWHFDLCKETLEEDNVIELVFYPDLEYDRQQAALLSYSLPENRAFSRKAQYQYGWDWGPKLVTCGIWKPVYLQLSNDFLIEDFQIYQDKITPEKAILNIETTVNAFEEGTINISYTVNNQQVVKIKDCFVKKGVNLIRQELTLNTPRLWYPHGLGEQPLYKVTVAVSNKKFIAQSARKIGLRNIELITDKDTIGSSFYFKVNGIPLFMKGANWIPADFFPKNITKEKYKNLLTACTNANMNMLRVWGGGYYEDDYFYQLCDELGILVWQDFMFACTLYPADSAFIQNVKEEAKEQICRLRNHACLALWCGNNEVKNGWEDWGWQYQYSNSVVNLIDSAQILLFNDVLPDMVTQYDRERAYHPSSPLWGWGHAESLTEGDAHYWGVWWGEEKFEVWNQKTGRFMSEFGYQSYPQYSTLKSITQEASPTLSSTAIQKHQKHPRGVAIITHAMDYYLGTVKNFEDFIYYSQILQSYGVGAALENFRLRKPYCMGALYWQLNDCWQVASWSSIDYFGNRKALYYEVARQYASVIIAVDSLCSMAPNIYVVNDQLEDIEAILQIELIDFDGNCIEKEKKNVKIMSNHASFIKKYTLDDIYLTKTDKLCLKLTLFKKNTNINNKITEKLYFFAYPKNLSFSPSSIELKVAQLGNIYTITLRSNTLAKYVCLSTQTEIKGIFSDNYFDLLPHEEKTISFVADKKQQKIIDFKVRSYLNSHR
ncbi:MAG: hypothetical protein LBU51_09670 [Bacteroidales bacterium]|nr:hypothetical protein [Bacteroidales bacterium]